MSALRSTFGGGPVVRQKLPVEHHHDGHQRDGDFFSSSTLKLIALVTPSPNCWWTSSVIAVGSPPHTGTAASAGTADSSTPSSRPVPTHIGWIGCTPAARNGPHDRPFHGVGELCQVRPLLIRAAAIYSVISSLVMLASMRSHRRQPNLPIRGFSLNVRSCVNQRNSYECAPRVGALLNCEPTSRD